MYQIETFNKIAPEGLARFDPALYQVDSGSGAPDAVLVRSADLLDLPFPDSLLAIARAGAGINNIPVDRCSRAGIAVFSTPGANANAVKELVFCGMLLASRDVIGGVRWVRAQAEAGADLSEVVEKGKSAFIGPELYRRSLGVIGLGAIGALVANQALGWGMDVYGYDPYLSVEAALRLDRHVHVVRDLKELYQKSDYITVHVHLTDQTRHMIGAEAIGSMRTGVRIIDLARGEIVDEEAMLTALDSGKVSCFVTDFPSARLLSSPHVIAMPHLGASTPESEQNCAVMAADQIRAYLEDGNVGRSVNLPAVSMARSGAMRICAIHRNVPAMLSGITTILSRDGANVENLSNMSKGDLAYTLVDLGTVVGEDVIRDVRAVPGMIRVRALR